MPMASVSIMTETLGCESSENRTRRKKLRVQMLYKIINDIVLLPPPTPEARMKRSYLGSHDFNNQRIYHPIVELIAIPHTIKH